MTPTLNYNLTRRTWLASSLAFFASRFASSAAPAIPNDLDIIDCHTHFYDPTRPEGIPWPPKDSSLYRTVLPKDLRAQKMFRPVTGTVIVEASSVIADNDWLLNLAKDDPFIVGIVGRLEPEDPNFAEQVKKYATHPLFRGIRTSTQVLKTKLAANDLSAFQALAAHDLSLDVNGSPVVPAQAAALAELVPDLRIVINHLGNVPITADAPPQAWQDGMRAAAQHPNVYCKISALVESAAQQSKKAPPADLAFYRPYINVVWNAFGDDRVIYGSNWPVSERGADYEILQRIALEYAAEKGEAALRKFCAENAQRAYKWVERPGRRRT